MNYAWTLTHSLRFFSQLENFKNVFVNRHCKIIRRKEGLLFTQPHCTLLLCHTVHKCHTPIKDLHHFPSRIMGKPVQISKCQLRINTFQLRSARAAAGGRGSLELCQAFSPHWGLITPHRHTHTLNSQTHNTMETSHHATISDWEREKRCSSRTAFEMSGFDEEEYKKTSTF